MPDKVVSVAPYRSATEGILWPAVPGRLGAELLSQLYQLEQSQYFPQELLRARQLQQFSLLARHAGATSAFYRARFEAAGIDASEPWTWHGSSALPPLARREQLTQANSINSKRPPKSQGSWQELQIPGARGELVALRARSLSMHDHGRDFRKALAVIRANVPAQNDEGQAREHGWGAPVSLRERSPARPNRSRRT